MQLRMYSTYVLGMIFLRYADLKFTTAKEEIEIQDLGTGRRTIGKQNYYSRGVLYVSLRTPVFRTFRILWEHIQLCYRYKFFAFRGFS